MIQATDPEMPNLARILESGYQARNAPVHVAVLNDQVQLFAAVEVVPESLQFSMSRPEFSSR